MACRRSLTPPLLPSAIEAGTEAPGFYSWEEEERVLHQVSTAVALILGGAMRKQQQLGEGIRPAAPVQGLCPHSLAGGDGGFLVLRKLAALLGGRRMGTGTSPLHWLWRGAGPVLPVRRLAWTASAGPCTIAICAG